MNELPGEEREIREILIAANSGEASDGQLARLDELIRSEPRLANYSARMLEQQAALAWQGISARPPQDSPGANSASPVATRRTDAGGAKPEPSRSAGHGMAWSTIAASIAFILGALGATLWRGDPWRGYSETRLAVAKPQAAAAEYEARLVRSTSCLWDRSSTGSRAIGSAVTSGESLDLLEGLAGINLSWSVGGNAVLSLEGPAAMMLSTEGMPTLRFGKLTATISTDRRPFVLDTPVGRLSIADYGSIGVSAFGNDAEIHVFDGSASLESAWMSTATSRDGAPLRIQAGQSVRIQGGDNGELVIERHQAEPSYFIAQVSMASDALAVPPTYVEAVKNAKPVGYWRMERGSWPAVTNEMGPRLACSVNGSIARTGRPDNQGIEFGVTDSGGDVLCDEVLDGQIGDSYTLEVWIKPSHYHVGAVVSLIGDPETPSAVNSHGMLLEMGGSGLMPTAVHHPGRIRFLHRSPASNDSDTGTSCYSTAAYSLRKWQHLVAVKDGAKMQLYINGALAGAGEDATKLPAGMRMLVGRLYPNRQVRPFKGQLDELALYDRALRPEEIVAHYRLIRPQTAPKQPAI